MAVLGRGREFFLQKGQGSAGGVQAMIIKYVDLLERLLQEDAILRQVRLNLLFVKPKLGFAAG